MIIIVLYNPVLINGINHVAELQSNISFECITWLCSMSFGVVYAADAIWHMIFIVFEVVYLFIRQSKTTYWLLGKLLNVITHACEVLFWL